MKAINTENAPAPVGSYSQAVATGNTVYLSGQIGLDPTTNKLVNGGVQEHAHQIFKNMQAVCQAAGGSLAQMVKLNVFLTSMSDFPIINDVMPQYFSEPYPARAAVAVKALPLGVDIEIEGVMYLER